MRIPYSFFLRLKPIYKTMKRIIIPLLIVIYATGAFSQETTISGRVLNKIGYKLKLVILDFDDHQLKGYEDKQYKGTKTVEADIGEDSLYQIVTDLISREYTSCKLVIGRRELPILLSPGDSLQLDVDYWLLNTSAGNWRGRGAGRNTYWSESNLLFDKSGMYLDLRNKRGAQKIYGIRATAQSQLELLERYKQNAQIDSAFYHWESKRIGYWQKDSELAYRLFQVRYYTPSSIAKADSLLGSIDLQDVEALETMKPYRSMIRQYLSFAADPKGDNTKGELGMRIDLAKSDLSGMIAAYALMNTIRTYVNQAETVKEKEEISRYAKGEVTDAQVRSLVHEMENKYALTHSKLFFDESEFQAIVWVLALLFLLPILFWAINHFLLSKTRQIAGPSIIRYMLVLGFVILALISFKNSDSLFPSLLLWYLVVIGVILSMTRWLLPRYAATKKYQRFFIYGFLIMMGYFIAINAIVRIDHNEWFGSTIFETTMVLGWVSMFVVVAYAYVMYYCRVLIQNKKGLQYLVDQGLLRIEYLVHYLIVSVAGIAILSVETSVEMVHSFHYFIIGMAVFYLTAYWLVPRHLLLKRFLAFSIRTVLTYGLLLLFMMTYLALTTFINLRASGIEISIFKTFDEPTFWILIMAVPGVIYAFARKVITDRENTGFALYRKTEAELMQLRSQVNPHFLFNSLNSVYAYALKDGKSKTAESIAKLANLMRYLIDDMDKDKIPIRKEIGYIEDYIRLQSIRSSVELDSKLKIDLNDEQQNLEIAPMMMIPFVENAFKHGLNPNKETKLRIQLSVHDQVFQFTIENSKDAEFTEFAKEKGFGIGIENVKKRLEYLYPNQHKLSIANTDDRFIVILEIHGLGSNEAE